MSLLVRVITLRDSANRLRTLKIPHVAGFDPFDLLEPATRYPEAKATCR